MSTGHMGRWLRAGTAVGLATGAVLVASSGVGAAPTIKYSLAPIAPYGVTTVGNYGGEPYIVSDVAGNLYDSSPSFGASAFLSTDQGATWKATTTPDASSGDTALGTDQSGSLYIANLAGSVSTAPLQADVFKSSDKGKTFTHSGSIATGSTACGTSCNPFGVDRQWVDGYIAPGPGQDTTNAEVVLMYHDFYGPSQIWVNISTDGGANFGAPIDIMDPAHLNPAGAVGGAIAQADSACDTVPVGLQIAKSGPHKGRIFAAWIASDPAAPATGCNLSQAQAFHNLIVAWSDNGGTTWTPQVAYDAGLLHDSSSPFAGFALDTQGNPYFGFTNNLNWDPTCAGPANPQTANCEFDMYVVWSADQGATWKGGAGTVPGSAGTPYKVNTDAGTHFFPWIAAQDPGHVVVAYLRTPSVIATGPQGKEYPGSCYPSAPNTSCTFNGPWDLWAGQTSNLNAADATTVSWTTTQITTKPMHIGDICNLGIACVPTVSNRNLLDFISVAIDPNGCAHVAFADDNTINKLLAANETSGCFNTPQVNAPEVPRVVLLIPLGLAAVWLVRRSRRGHRDATV